ncbi:MAG TPA: hypothetical protein PLS50_04060, partial [Candidatus Dojkabacteria bacterium]|nr:hypothetical protein [Candidatus Dojkabacteria bacterium]
MKNLVLGLIAILLVVSSNVHSQNPHFTRDYPGIPVISQNGDWWHLINNDLVPYDSMKSMGVRYFWNTITDKIPQMGLVVNKGFKIIPVHLTEGTTVYNWIGYYCDAKYTEWEAEGTDTINIGKATLERDLQKTTPSPNGNYISTVPYAPASTILWGPYYYQERNYMIKRANADTLFYNAEFKLMLERNLSYPPYDTTTDNPTDQICKMMVTQSRVNNSTTPWHIDSVITIDSLVLYRSDFPTINQFITKLLRYDLSIGFPVSNQLNIPRYRAADIPPDSMGRFLRENIEFKVVWLGDPKYLLSVDKVTVYDERGEALYKDSLGTGVRLRIKNQIDQLLSYDNSVVGWHGIDEPFSIDNFEPIRIVAQTVRDHNKQLYLPFMGFWDGVWQNTYNPFGTNHLSPHKEFFMRTNGLVNIWQNFYMYDQPFKDTSYIDPVKFGTTGYKDINIRITANNYSLARSIDSL